MSDEIDKALEEIINSTAPTTPAQIPVPVTEPTTTTLTEWPPSLVVSVDPSIRSMGYAIFVHGRLVKSGCIKEQKENEDKPLAVRIQVQVSELAKIIPTSADGLYLVIEEPSAFESSISMAAAHNHSLKKLMMVVGAVCWHGFLLKATTVFIPVASWKGQLPKTVTTPRIEAKFKKKFATSDEADAVGIGDWFLTAGNKEKLRI